MVVQTPTMSYSNHYQVFTSSFPNQPFARMSGLEPETPSFGD